MEEELFFKNKPARLFLRGEPFLSVQAGRDVTTLGLSLQCPVGAPLTAPFSAHQSLSPQSS